MKWLFLFQSGILDALYSWNPNLDTYIQLYTVTAVWAFQNDMSWRSYKPQWPPQVNRFMPVRPKDALPNLIISLWLEFLMEYTSIWSRNADQKQMYKPPLNTLWTSAQFAQYLQKYYGTRRHISDGYPGINVSPILPWSKNGCNNSCQESWHLLCLSTKWSNPRKRSGP